MYDRNRSGQFLYFPLISAISGNIVINASGNISGRRSIDGAGLSLLSGFVGEVTAGQGMYVANLFDFDLNGNNIGFLFTASGCVPTSFTVITQQNVSGRVYIASGTGVVLASGSMSGQLVTLLSGFSFPASGVFTVATASVASGSLYLASGSIFRETYASGVIAASGGFVTAWGNSGQVFSASGANAVVPPATLSGTTVIVIKDLLSGVVANSGLTVTVLPATISGTAATVFKDLLSGVVANSGLFVNVPIATISGTTVVLPKETISGVVANSGLFVTATVSVASGSLYLASGSIFRETYASGVVGASGGFVTAWGNSGQAFSASGANAVVPPATLSGVAATVFKDLLSGVVANSGLTVTVLKDLLSGVVANSGLTVTVIPATISGTFVTLPKETISGVVANSGLFVTATVSVASGSLYLASGSIFRETYASGVVGASGGFVTAWGNSGQSFSASGANAVVPPATLSGVVANSGLTVTVLPATISGVTVILPKETISGVVANSGLFVTAVATVGSGVLYLASGSIFRETYASGVLGASGGHTLAWGDSGQAWSASGANVVVPKETLSGVVANSGLFVTANATVASGSLYLASGSIFRETYASGVLGASGGHTLAWGNSGQALAASGSFAAVPPATLSGTTVILPKETISGVVANSGLAVTVFKDLLSGVVANSGLAVTVFKDLLSGVVANSGLTVTVLPATISGTFATVPKETLSGVVANSGLFVTATASVASGSLYLASGSIFRETYASGVLGASGGHTLAWGNSGQGFSASGATVVLPKDTISGVVAATISGTIFPASGTAGSPASGQVWLASGHETALYSGQTVNVFSGQLSGFQMTARTVSDKSGYTLAGAGLDVVQLESGLVNARQGLAIVTAAEAGRVSGAGTATFRIAAADDATTNRITATVDASGNRTSITLNLP